jgi:hypothetical protein
LRNVLERRQDRRCARRRSRRPHHGDPIKFWNGKLQSLCAHCHESRKKFLELRGYDNTISADGMPIDPRHPVYGVP